MSNAEPDPKQSFFSPTDLQAIEQLRKELPPDQQPDDVTLVRFLRARQMNVANAKQMYLKCVAWRQDNKVDEIGQQPRPMDDVLNVLISSSHHGLDKHGRPMYIEKTGLLQPAIWVELIPEDIVVKTHIWFMEITLRRMREASQKTGKIITKCVNIMDMKGLGVQHRKLVPLFNVIGQIDQNYYPEILGGIYIINCPWIFSVFWKMCSPFLDKVTKEKIHILSSDLTEMINDLGAEYIPEEYGGSCRCANGCTQALHTVEEMRALMKAKSINTGDMELKEVVVAAATSHEITLQIEKNSALDWFFRTIKYDIQFEIKFIPDEKSSDVIVVRKQERVNSYQNPEEGTYTFEQSGTCKVIWDNTYSRWTAKTVQFYLRVSNVQKSRPSLVEDPRIADELAKLPHEKSEPDGKSDK